MPEDKYINTETTVTTTATTIEIFTEYVVPDWWILRTGYWDDDGIWDDNDIWID